MKNLDIEKLERQNVYKVPEHFFAEMQQKVLAETAQKKEAKIFKMNWAYSAAAAVALLFGVTFFINQSNDTTETANPKNTISINNKSQETIAAPTNNIENDATIAYQNFEKNLTIVTENNQKDEQSSVAMISKNNNQTVDQNKKEVVANPEIQVDQILANFTTAELADVGKNTEQDIYLDLYN